MFAHLSCDIKSDKSHTSKYRLEFNVQEERFCLFSEIEITCISTVIRLSTESSTEIQLKGSALVGLSYKFHF